MFGFFRSPGHKLPKQTSAEDHGATKEGIGARRTASEPNLPVPDMGNGDHVELRSMTTEELEDYAVMKSEETTNAVQNCRRIAEDIKQNATATLDTLHQQGEQITRTHEKAFEIDKDLSKGEKLLNNLGGMFSKTWKPKKTREIAGPVTTPDKTSRRAANRAKQRERLGLAPLPKGKSGGSKTPPPEPTNAMQKVELEKAKQEDALSDLSNVLGDLKSMAVDMGNELNQQNKAMDHLSDDMDELKARAKSADQRGRHLLNK